MVYLVRRSSVLWAKLFSPVCCALGMGSLMSPLKRGNPTKPVTLDLVLAARDLTADGHELLLVLLPLGFNGGGG